MEACRLCDALDYNNKLSTRKYNQVLMRTNHFVVMPALGPLLVGHVMVITKKHVPNIASLPITVRREYEQLAKHIRAKIFYSISDVLETEHGSTNVKTAGACIMHAHVNFFPSLGPALYKFDESMYPTHSNNDYLQLPSTIAPYLYVRNGVDSRSYSAENLPSQYVRQQLRFFDGRQDWDWREDPGMDVVEETIRIWNE